MARYTGPTCKLARRDGVDLELKSQARGLESKCKLNQLPGTTGVNETDETIRPTLCSCARSRKSGVSTVYLNASSVIITSWLQNRKAPRVKTCCACWKARPGQCRLPDGICGNPRPGPADGIA